MARSACYLLSLCSLLACSDDSGGGKLDSQVPDSSEKKDGAAPACTVWVLNANKEIYNSRDVGGLALDSGYQVACKKIYKGGDLTRITAGKGCDELNTLGIKTVIDLREPDEQTKKPNASCVSVTQVTATLSKHLPDSPENYVAVLNDAAGIKTLFETLGNKASYPVFMHCVIGRDRAAQAAGLALLALGASKQAIVDEFKLSDQAPDIAITTKPASMEAFVNEVEKKGGIDTFLKSVGVTDAQINVLRDVAREKK